MAKSQNRLYSKPADATRPKDGKALSSPNSFVDRSLANVNPLKQQFEPTDSQPVPQRYKMAGGC